MTSRLTLAGWFDEGVGQGASHMIVKWDSFDGPEGDYPVYVMPGDDLAEKERGGDAVQEVYVLDPARKGEQMAERRAFHREPYTPTPPTPAEPEPAKIEPEVTDPRLAPVMDRILMIHPSWYKRLSLKTNRSTEEARYAAQTIAEGVLRALDEAAKAGS